MTEYCAPLDEMKSQIRQAYELAQLGTLEDQEPFHSDMIDAVITEASKLSARVLSPINQSGDIEGCQFADGKVTTPKGWKAAYNRLREDGWIGLTLPEELGGQALPKLIAQPVNEMWHSGNAALVMMNGLAQGGTEILLHYGSEALKQRYLEKIASGDWGIAMSLTEPQAGSDLGELKTKAIPQSDGTYLIKGQKIYISYGDHDLTENILHLVLARTPDAPVGSRGISLFAVPKYRVNDEGAPGEFNDLRCTGIEHKLGLHGSPTCSISYGDKDNCLGELIGEENAGLKAMFILMNEARLATGMQGVGFSQLAYQKALAYANERVQGRHYLTNTPNTPISEHPDVARLLMHLKSQTIGLRSLGYLIAALIDKSERSSDLKTRDEAAARVALLTPIFKAFSSERANQLAGMAIQVFGGMGFVEETGIAQILRDVRITTIYEGTTAIQAKDLLFRKIRLDQGQTLSALLAEIQATARQLEASSGLASLGSDLKDAVVAMQSRMETLICGDVDLLQFNAGGVPLLEALGYLISAWLLGDLTLREDEPESSIKNCAQFYSAHLLPMTKTQLEVFDRAGQGLG